MSDRTWCGVCEKWVGGGVGHDREEHDWDGPEVDMTAVSVELAQEHVDLKNDLRDLADEWAKGHGPTGKMCARDLRDALEDC